MIIKGVIIEDNVDLSKILEAVVGAQNLKCARVIGYESVETRDCCVNLRYLPSRLAQSQDFLEVVQ